MTEPGWTVDDAPAETTLLSVAGIWMLGPLGGGARFEAAAGAVEASGPGATLCRTTVCHYTHMAAVLNGVARERTSARLRLLPAKGASELRISS